MLTQKRLKYLLRYVPETGKWTWIVRRNGVRNDFAGTPDGLGYIQIRIDGIKYRSCRLAFLYMTGKFPDQFVDHINRVKNDDRWENLRNATQSQNAVNAIRKRGKLPRGVHRVQGGFQARISIDGTRKHIGLYKTPDAAHAAYMKASKFREHFLPEEER
jgi:hypothetical protein